MESLLHRFLRYIAVDTQSDELSETQPSTGKQLKLLEMLRDELKSMGVDAELDEWGYVMASIPANIEGDIPAIGFIAHVDTSPDASGAGVKPQIVENYDGGDIPLSGVPGMVLRVKDFGFGGAAVMGGLWNKFDPALDYNYQELIAHFKKLKKLAD